MVLLKPVDIVDNGDVSGLDATVVAIDRAGAAHGGVLEVAGFLLGGEEFDVIAQCALIAFEGDNRNGNAIINRNALAQFPCQNQHSTLRGGYAVWCAGCR